MLKFAKLAAGLAIVPVVAYAGVANAAGGGQIEGGDIYRVKNVTKGSDFVDLASADAGDTLTYKVRIHNPGQECLSNVVVKAALPGGSDKTNTSTITVKADNATTNFISDTVTVNLSSAQTINYVPNSTQLLDANGAVKSTLPETLFSSGVNIGSICVSENNKEYVQFQAKVSTPAPTPTPTPTPTTTTAAPAPKALPNTGPGEVAGLFAGASALGAAGHYVTTRRNRR